MSGRLRGALSDWVRRNRWGLVALPVVLVLAAAANAQRLDDYWWDQTFQRATATASTGEWVRHSEEFLDALGTTTRTLEVRVGEPVEVVSFLGDDALPVPVDLPEGLVAVGVPLDFRAEPDQVLGGCSVALLDADGNRYEPSDLGAVPQPFDPCLLDGSPGPSYSLSPDQPHQAAPGAARPTSWSTRPVVVLPDDVEITAVRVWWLPPYFVEVSLP